MNNLYPIKFENLYYERIWGGKDFEKFRDNLPKNKVIGESWDIACHKNGMGKVVNGSLEGKTFEEIIELYRQKIIGTDVNLDKFPLLIKLIAADQKLSVQVHPDDEYAKKAENDSGKTEAWYVVDAKEGACLIAGTKDCDKEIFEEALKNEDIEKYLNKIPVKKGDFIYIKSGLVHAICEGVLIAEIQQSSDTTYRVYDYNRGREIHIKKALDVIDFNIKVKLSEEVQEVNEGYKKTQLCQSEYFVIEKYEIKESLEEESDIRQFFLFTCVEGNGSIRFDGNKEEKIKMGDSILIPAYLGKYELIGSFTLLKSYIEK